MIFQVFPSVVKASGSAGELETLRSVATYEIGDNRGKPVFLGLFDTLTRTFPVGLLPELTDKLRCAGVPVVVNDFRTPPTKRQGLPLAWLFPYQREALEAVIRHTVGCIDIPTAGGKGEILAALPAELPCVWLILADDKKVCSQLGGADGRIAKRTGIKPGRCYSGIWEDTARVTVASPAMLYQRWNGHTWDAAAQRLLSRVQAVAYDEAHMSGSTRSQHILASIPNAYFRVGFSASLEGRSDKRDATVRAQFGPVIHKITPAELEGKGVIAKQEIFFVRCAQRNVLPFQTGGYMEGVCLSKTRNSLVAKLWKKERSGVLTFVHEITHGNYLLRCAQHLGIRADFAHGERTTAQNDKALDDFERGNIDVLICTNVFKQGVDIIHAYSGINAAGKMSVIEVIQRRGRAGRICRTENCPRCAEMGKKTSARWYDLYDVDSDAEAAARKGQRLSGLWLRKHSEARVAAYRSKGLAVEMLDGA